MFFRFCDNGLRQRVSRVSNILLSCHPYILDRFIVTFTAFPEADHRRSNVMLPQGRLVCIVCNNNNFPMFSKSYLNCHFLSPLPSFPVCRWAVIQLGDFCISLRLVCNGRLMDTLLIFAACEIIFWACRPNFNLLSKGISPRISNPTRGLPAGLCVSLRCSTLRGGLSLFTDEFLWSY